MEWKQAANEGNLLSLTVIKWQPAMCVPEAEGREGKGVNGSERGSFSWGHQVHSLSLRRLSP